MMPFLLAGDSYKILVLMNMAIVAGFSHLSDIAFIQKGCFVLLAVTLICKELLWGVCNCDANIWGLDNTAVSALLHSKGMHLTQKVTVVLVILGY